jgi:hypothetical protein
VLANVLAIWLACPPTADADAAPKQQYFRATPQHASPYAHLDHVEREPFDWASLEVAQVDPPQFEFLPLWDLLASVTALEEATLRDTEAYWLRWAIETAGDRPDHAAEALFHALIAKPPSAGRLLWWRNASSPTPELLEALLEGYEWAETPEARTLLATALALAHWELSCPVAIAPDGACRMPGSSVIDRKQTMIRREPIAVERARTWTEIAVKLRRKAKFDPEDLAVAELFAELELAASSEDYEGLLSARMPGDLNFIVEDWRHESGVPRWERLYERQVVRADESKARYSAFIGSRAHCWSQLYEVHIDVLRGSATLATRAMLREATILFTFGCAEMELLCDHAADVARQCIEFGTTLAGETAVIDACRSILDALVRNPDRLVELVPEPSSTSVMQSHGVLGPEWL